MTIGEMEMCEFCEGKIIKSTNYEGDILPFRLMFSSIVRCDYSSDEAVNGIFLNEDNMMGFNNSDGEYATQFVKINYCPMCGRDLRKENTDD